MHGNVPAGHQNAILRRAAGSVVLEGPDGVLIGIHLVPEADVHASIEDVDCIWLRDNGGLYV